MKRKPPKPPKPPKGVHPTLGKKTGAKLANGSAHPTAHPWRAGVSARAAFMPLRKDPTGPMPREAYDEASARYAAVADEIKDFDRYLAEEGQRAAEREALAGFGGPRFDYNSDGELVQR